MLKRKAVDKLPTLLQYLKEKDLRDSLVRAPIEKIFWSSDWKTITFQTDVFRYSIKFNTGEEFREGISEILDAFDPNKPMDGWVVYDGDDNGDVDIIWQAISETTLHNWYNWFKQWDWGLTSEPRKVTEKFHPAGKKKPSSKMKPDTPPAQLDPTL